MIDSYGRKINYLRLSLTQNCNLNCLYCKPDKNQYFKPTVLDLEELKRILDILVVLGIDKLRFTGGEPLLYHNFEEILLYVSQTKDLKTLALTTNGILLDDYFDLLTHCKVKKINIGINSLNPHTYFKLTKSSNCLRVINNIEKAIQHEFEVSLNIVLIKNINDHEIESWVNFISEYPVSIRFIELMPLGNAIQYEGISGNKVYNELISLGYKLNRLNNASIANMYQIDDKKGTIGFINPISNKFCSTCNRIRITNQGNLLLCLYDNKKLDIKKILTNYHDAQIINIIESFIQSKPLEHDMSSEMKSQKNHIKMFEIGG